MTNTVYPMAEKASTVFVEDTAIQACNRAVHQKREKL
jgi:hypothetical protein